MKIKICGLKSLDDIKIINKAKTNYAGFIFAKNSKRKIDFNLALKMKENINPEIKVTGVFANQEIKEIAELTGIIDVIQLHGDEDNNYIKSLKEMTDKKIIKAYKADNQLKENIENSLADYILIDSNSKSSFGGTGITFDWNIIPKTDKKIFLAGGLNINNIEKAIKMVNPYCLDINSGVETFGKKDEKKVIEIVKLIREIDKTKGKYNG